MSKLRIQMGNDEFILYIKKIYKSCKTPNQELGQQIWARLEAIPGADAKQEKLNEPCLWPIDNDLPKTAAQFSFNRSVLPKLYDCLDELGGGKNNK